METLIDNYVRWLETLSQAGVHRLNPMVARTVTHRTPEQEGAGPDAVIAAFARIFDGMASVKTKVTDRAASADGHTVYLRWDRLMSTTRGQVITMSGVSEVMVGMDGKIAAIIDYWDTVLEARPGFFARLFKR